MQPGPMSLRADWLVQASVIRPPVAQKRCSVLVRDHVAMATEGEEDAAHWLGMCWR